MSNIREVTEFEANNVGWVTEKHIGRPYVIDDGKMQLCQTRKVAIVEQDDEPIDPTVDYDMLGTMACWHRGYKLGHEQPQENPDEYRERLIEEFEEGFGERLEARATRLFHQLSSQGTKIEDTLKAINEMVSVAIERKFDEYYLCLPLYLYDHSGITMNTSGFSCGWDSGQVGIIYISKKAVREEYGWKRLTAKRVAQIETYLRGEVETYDHVLTGNTWQFQVEEQAWDPITEEWETFEDYLDSCHGFLGDFGDPVKTGIVEHLSDEVELIIHKVFDDEYDMQDLRVAA